MNIEELKKLVKKSTAVLILDNGEPSFVILGYDFYRDLVFQEPVKEVKISSSRSETGHSDKIPGLGPVSTTNGLSHNERKSDMEAEVLEKINNDILALKEEIEKEEKMTSID